MHWLRRGEGGRLRSAAGWLWGVAAMRYGQGRSLLPAERAERESSGHLFGEGLVRGSWARVQGDLVAGDREVAALMFVSEERGIREPGSCSRYAVHSASAGERV